MTYLETLMIFSIKMILIKFLLKQNMNIKIKMKNRDLISWVDLVINSSSRILDLKIKTMVSMKKKKKRFRVHLLGTTIIILMSRKCHQETGTPTLSTNNNIKSKRISVILKLPLTFLMMLPRRIVGSSNNPYLNLIYLEDWQT